MTGCYRAALMGAPRVDIDDAKISSYNAPMRRKPGYDRPPRARHPGGRDDPAGMGVAEPHGFLLARTIGDGAGRSASRPTGRCTRRSTGWSGRAASRAAGRTRTSPPKRRARDDACTGSRRWARRPSPMPAPPTRWPIRAPRRPRARVSVDDDLAPPGATGRRLGRGARLGRGLHARAARGDARAAAREVAGDLARRRSTPSAAATGAACSGSGCVRLVARDPGRPGMAAALMRRRWRATCTARCRGSR